MHLGHAEQLRKPTTQRSPSPITPTTTVGGPAWTRNRHRPQPVRDLSHEERVYAYGHLYSFLSRGTLEASQQRAAHAMRSKSAAMFRAMSDQGIPTTMSASYRLLNAASSQSGMHELPVRSDTLQTTTKLAVISASSSHHVRRILEACPGLADGPSASTYPRRDPGFPVAQGCRSPRRGRLFAAGGVNRSHLRGTLSAAVPRRGWGQMRRRTVTHEVGHTVMRHLMRLAPPQGDAAGPATLWSRMGHSDA